MNAPLRKAEAVDLFGPVDNPTTRLEIELPAHQCWALEVFCRRSCWQDFRRLAVNGDEANSMIESLEAIRAALNAAGFRTR